MPRRSLTKEEKLRRWKAILSAAMSYHRAEKEHGMGARIATDAGVTAQSVSDWKRGETAADEAQLIRLASKYGVSAEELSGLSGTEVAEEQRYLENDEFSKLSMELVGAVTKELLPEGTYDQYRAIYQKAHDLLLEGKDEDAAYGALFRFVVDLKRGAQAEATD